MLSVVLSIGNNLMGVRAVWPISMSIFGVAGGVLLVNPVSDAFSILDI